MPDNTPEPEYATKLEMLLESARRANWDAQRGPKHLRTGRLNPSDMIRTQSDPQVTVRGGESIDITLSPETTQRLQKLATTHNQSPSEVIVQALKLLEDYQRWADEQDLADVEAVRQEIKQEGTIPWETVKENLGQ